MNMIEREITDFDQIEDLLKVARVCRVALHDGEFPYIVPMCFGYSLKGGKLELYFVSVDKGKKIDLIKADNNAAFEIDKLLDIVQDTETPTGFSVAYRSITGTGTLENVTGIDKITGLNRIMTKFGENAQGIKYSEQTLNSFAVLKLTAGELCCKEHCTNS